MAGADAIFTLGADTKAALASVKGFTDKATGAFNELKYIAVGAITAFAGKAAIGQLSDFSKAISEIKSIAGDTAGSTRDLSLSMIEMGSRFGRDAQGQAKAFYSIISAGITDSAEAQKTLVAANKLAIGGLASTEEAVDIITTAMNVYSESNLSAAQSADALFKAVKLGKTTVPQLASSLGKLLPNANALGQSFETAAGAVAALTAGGLSTAEATTAMNALFAGIIGAQSKLSKESKEVQEAFDIQNLKTKSLAEALRDMNKAVDGDQVKLKELLGSVQGLTGFLSFAKDDFDTLANSIDGVTNSAGEADKAFKTVKKSFGEQLDTLKTNLGNLVLRFTVEGEAFAADILQSLNDFVLELIKNVPIVVAKFKAFFDKIKKIDFEQLAKSLATFTAVFYGGKGLIAALDGTAVASLRAIAGMLKLAAPVIAAAVAIDLLVANWNKLTSLGQTANIDVLIAQQETLLKNMQEGVKLLGIEIQAPIPEKVDEIRERLQKLYAERDAAAHKFDQEEWSSGLIGVVGDTIDSVVAGVNTSVDVASAGVKKLKNEIEGIPEPKKQEKMLQPAAESFLDTIYSGMQDVWGGIVDAGENLVEMFEDGGGLFGDPKKAKKTAKNTGEEIGEEAGKEMSKKAKNGLVAPLVSSMLKGAEGAKKTLGAGVEALGAAFGVAGLGPIAEQLMTLGPEGARQMINEFVDAVPDLIATLADAAPVVIEALIDSLLLRGGLERIVVALVKAAPRIGLAIFEGIYNALIGAQPSVGSAMAVNFMDGIKGGKIGLDVGAGLNLSSVNTGLNNIYGVTNDILDAITSDDTPVGKLLGNLREVGDKIADGVGKAMTGIGKGLSPLFEKLIQRLSAFGEAFALGFERAFGSSLQKMSEGLTAASTAFFELFNSVIPEAIGAFGEALQAGIESIRKISFPEFMRQLQAFFNNAISSFFPRLTMALGSLGSWMNEFIIKFRVWVNRLLTIPQNIQNSINNFFTNLWGAYEWFMKSIYKIFNWLPNAIRRAIPGGGGGNGDAWGSAGHKYLAEGGRIPFGFPNDSYPAMLTSGEQVFSSDLSSRLESFLNGQGAANKQPIVVQLQIGEERLADVMLNLNLNNQRLTA